MVGMTEGRIVHYVEQGVNHCMAAIVVRPWGASCANLLVFKDGTNDTVPNVAADALSFWATSAIESDSLTVDRAFHDPKTCPHLFPTAHKE